MAQDKFEVRLRGNLGADPEWIGNTGNMLKISVGVKTKEKNQESTTWQTVIFFNNDKVKLADWASSQMRKGSKVIIEGRGHFNSFTPQGAQQPVRVFEVIAESFDVVEMPRPANQQQPVPDYHQQPQQQTGHHQPAPAYHQQPQQQTGHHQAAPAYHQQPQQPIGHHQPVPTHQQPHYANQQPLPPPGYHQQSR